MSKTAARLARGATVRRRRKRRRGEYVCECRAYSFPHRFGGGACSGRWIVVKQWKSSQGWCGDCLRCHANDRREVTCQVIEGQEEVAQCPAWQSFVHLHEIRIYGKAGTARNRAPRRVVDTHPRAVGRINRERK